ncbi:MAG TPA: hypothetical protein VGR32_09215 [Brevundimonas sp.]|jgi:hypothetical protein|uniref:hypothetical protein n=1 Tax=Brevundimonas sp. TaxID=1871086 RepID=UPI002DF4844C|nr:hypothetical protein [Brevundimonas sp.]
MRNRITVALSGALLGLAATAATAQEIGEIYRVEDVVVVGRRLDEAATRFVAEVAAPAGNRGTARWDEGVCVGAANFTPEVAQYLVDRVSDMVRDLGLRAHEPPCHPSILIIGTTDGAAFASDLVSRRPKLFVVGGSGMDQGYDDLAVFQRSDAPVRWWHVSAPVDDETGLIAVRLPGMHSVVPTTDPENLMLENHAPTVTRNFASRLRQPLRDVMKRSIVIVDVDRLDGTSLEQLADYVTFVSLAQVDPEADLSRFDSILNLFEPGRAPPGLSAWDLAYLEGLYSVRQGYVGRNAHASALARSILEAYEARVPRE